MKNKKEKKPYQKPQIIYETKLEVRAGTPLGGSEPLFPFFPDRPIRKP
jgi:hypothetical protein